MEKHGSKKQNQSHRLQKCAAIALSTGMQGQQFFRVKPHDMSVVAGRTAELHCNIGNRAGLVQWSKDGFLLGYDPTIPGYERYEMKVDSTKSAYTLLVHEARLDDEAEYQCQVGPGKNEKPIRSVAKLTVLVPPKHLSINNLPNKSEIEVREGEKVVLQCQAPSSKPATILKWFRKNIELMPEASRTTVRREGEKLYSTLSSITLYPKGDTSGSTYTCEALHPGLEKPLRSTVGVGVLYPPSHPEIVGYKEGEVLQIGDHLTLLCSSTGGKPRAVITWFRNGEKAESTCTGAGRDSSCTLAFLVQDADNNAVYSCTASNPLTSIPLMASVKLAVVYPPSHVWVTGSSEVVEGEQITLSCKSDASNPAIELGWLVDGVAHQAQESAVHSLPHGFYTVSNLTATLSRQDKDMKTFVCVTHGVPRHEKVFHAFNVTLLYPPEVPSIAGYKEGDVLRYGDYKSLKCSTLAGNPPAKLRWYKSDHEVQGVTRIASGLISSVLYFEVEDSDNDKSVRCEVNNSLLAEPLATSVKLNVLFPPSNVTVTISPPQPREGDMVRLECVSTSSNPAAHIIWWKDGTVFKGKAHAQSTFSSHGGSSTRSHISLPVTSSDDSTKYTCEAKNDAFQRSVQDEIFLRVSYAPVFSTSRKVVELVEGKSTEVNMTANAHPAVHSYKWNKDGTPVSRKNENYRQPLSISSDGPFLYFNHVSRHDAGVYTCIAQNTEGSATATLTLNVLYPAIILNISAAIEVEEGESFHLQCSADGNPLTENTLTWQRMGETKASVTSFRSDLTLSVLSVVNVSRQDAGIYECVADNGIGRASVRTVHVFVQYRPSIVRNLPHRVAAGENDSAELKCIAEGHPEVTFAWSYNGSALRSGSFGTQRHVISQSQREANERSSTLLLKAMSPADYGVYTCIARNQLGHDRVTFDVVKKSVPDPPTALQALNISHQSVLLTWLSGFDGGLTQTFQLRVRKNQESTMTFIHIPMNLSSYTLSGLNQGTSYQVSIAAKNSLGESQYGAPITLRTKSLPVMDSTVSGPVLNDNSSVEFLPAWLLASAVIGGIVVVANVLVCIFYIQRKHWCRYAHGVSESSASDDEISREKIAKKIPSDHSPFYLTGASVEMPDDGLDEDNFQKAPGIKLRQVSRESSEDAYSLSRRCDCGGRQWSSSLICGGRSPGEDRVDNTHEQCPDILKRDSCHCHNISAAGAKSSDTEVEISSSLGAVMYGMKERPQLSCDSQTISSRDPCPPQITLTTFQSKSELPIRHTIIGPKLETVINGHGDDS